MGRIRDNIDAGVRAAKIGRGIVRVMAAPDESTRARARAHLAAFMGAERGLSAKIGQLLAGRDQGEEFRFCNEGLEPITELETRAILTEAWGRPVEDIVARFEGRGIAASIGQVVRATLHDGRDVAIKIRYPGIRRSLEAELRVLGLVPGIGPARRWGLDLGGLKRVLSSRLRAELDYLEEAERQTAYRASLSPECGIVVAAVHHDLCRGNVLVQDWESGQDFETALRTCSGTQRRRLGQILLRHFCQRFFVAGSVHADPHDGNIRFRINAAGEPEVLLYDFGALAPFETERALALLRLALAARERSGDRPLACLAAAGFDAAKLDKLAASLTELTRILVEPIAVDHPFDTASWRAGERLRAFLGEESWWFRSAGPPEFLQVMRAIDGLARQLARLGARLEWFRELQAAVPEALEAARNLNLPEVEGGSAFVSLAQRLRVRVRRDGEEVVSVAMPIRVLEDLTAVMDEELVARLRARGLDPILIAAEARRKGCRPGLLFSDEDGDKVVSVHLE